MGTNPGQNPQPNISPFYNYPNDDEFEISDDDFLEDSISRVHSDEELEVVIKELLHNSKRVDASDITVSVDQTNVHLSGSVKSQEDRDYAINVVKLIHGVGDVHSDLIVKLNDGILPTDIGRN
jgi:osmotically-inducible protein OsmY